MLLASRLVTAERAYNVGAVMEVTDALDDAVTSLVKGILQASRNTLVATKEQLLRRSFLFKDVDSLPDLPAPPAIRAGEFLRGR